jgi:DNA polymerase III alpha subunit (gram-positive type)
MESKYIVGIDLETTGLDPKVDHIVELAYVVMDVPRWTPVVVVNQLISGVKVPAKITELTGITQDDCDTFGIARDWAVIHLNGHLERLQPRCLVAHNARFEQGFLVQECWSTGINEPVCPWLDTRYDLPYPPGIQGRKLSALATAHGVKNPFEHRALFDVLEMLAILKQYDLDAAMEVSQISPLVDMQVDGFTREEGVGWGFYWKAGTWHRQVREAYLADEAGFLQSQGFEVRVAEFAP